MYRRLVFQPREVNLHLVHKAPAPVFTGLDGLNNGMVRRVEMFSGMLVPRRIAAAHMSANATQPKVNPAVAGLQTFLAPACMWFLVSNLIQMLTVTSHK